jgi:UDP-galactopyranose mutase
MDFFDYLVVGAGFAGSVCAERLASTGKRVIVVDQRAHVGGNAYDEYDDAGILVHRYGPHIFHTNSRAVFEYLSRFTEWRPYQHRVLSSVDGRLVPFPINRNTLDLFEGDLDGARKRLIAGYTRKQWGDDADVLVPAVLARVAPRDTRDDRYFTDTYQAMPLHGYTRLFERMLAHPKIKLLLKTSFREIAQLLSPAYDPALPTRRQPTIIYTGPVDEYFGYRFGRLPYRSAEFRFETLDEERHQPAAVVNYPNEYDFTRVTEFKQLTGQRHQKTTIAYEYPRAVGDPYWPVPTANNAALAKRYQELAAATPGVHFAGRLGTYRYYNMDQVIAQALRLAAKLTLASEETSVCQV